MKMTDVNWRRVFTISSLIFAFALVCGSIYLHLKQKHHFGRLQRVNSIVPSAGVAAAVVKPTVIEHFESDYYYDEETAEINESTPTENLFEPFRKSPKTPPTITSTTLDSFKRKTITEACIHCICQVATECKAVSCGANGPCGIFRISKPYWIDAGSPRLSVDKDSMIQAHETDAGYGDCVNNAHCAKRAVAAFVDKYARDCNHDSSIDCRDHIALHILGPQGCSRNLLSSPFDTRMEKCLAGFAGQN